MSASTRAARLLGCVRLPCRAPSHRCVPCVSDCPPTPQSQVLADGTLLNEGAAVLQWIADQAPASGLAPANGTSARYLLQAKLNYLASEVHASIGPLFNPALAGEARTAQVEKLNTKLKWMEEKELADKEFVVGGAFTVADAYFYIILTWTPYVGVEISKSLQAYRDRVGSLDFVKAAHAAMAAASPKKA